jgi:hypothetical protein
VRWPLAHGTHSFQVRLPGIDASSAPVRISVR